VDKFENPLIKIKDVRTPIVVGVTGHRDLRNEDLPILREHIYNILVELSQQYPFTPLVLLTPLAEGADRLAAKVAIDLSIKIIAPLPMPLIEYRQDFETDISLTEFDELLSKTEEYFVVPIMKPDESDSVQSVCDNRDEKYAFASAYIVSYCQILIALWDGENNESIGGTANTVRLKLEGIPEQYTLPKSPLNPIERGSVYHILTPRISNPLPNKEAFALYKYFPRGWEDDTNAATYYAQLLKRIDSYNQDLIKLTPELEEEITKGKESIIPSSQARSLPPVLNYILDGYAITDTLAIWYQQKRRKTMIGLFTMGILSFFFFEIYAHLYPGLPGILAMYPAMLFIAYLWYRLAGHREYQNKYLDYRCLAEGLRVQFFWELVRLNENVAEYYLQRQKSELDWIRYALKTCTLMLDKSNYPDKIDETENGLRNYNLLLEHWVNDQRDFFKRTANRDNTKLKRQKYWSEGLFLGGLFLSLLMVLASVFLPHAKMFETFHPYLIVVMVLTAAIAAALEGYAEKMAFSEQAKQYQRMSILFDQASQKLTSLLLKKNTSAARRLIRELGKEALLENGDWLFMHRERPMKVPISG